MEVSSGKNKGKSEGKRKNTTEDKIRKNPKRSYQIRPGCTCQPDGHTPYSMNRLFSEFFRKSGGAFLEVCETISGGSGEAFRGKKKENYPEKNRKHLTNSIRYCTMLFNIALNSLFKE